MTNAPEAWRQAGRSVDTVPDIGAKVNPWVNIVRRARLGSSCYAVALTVASYANGDGTSIRMGAARLAWDCEVSLATAKRGLRKLRNAGLIELVRRGNRRAGRADEYRLILAEDVLERIEVPDPEAERAGIEALKDADRESSRARYERRSRVTHDPRTEDSMEAQRGLSEDSVSDSRATFTGHPRPVNGLSRVTSGRLSRVTSDPSPSSSTLQSSYPPDIPLSRDQRLLTAQQNKPWADLQNRYDRGDLDDWQVTIEIEERIGGFDEAEERTATGMLASGSHVKAIANKILADRRANSRNLAKPRANSCEDSPDGQVDFAEWQYDPAQCACGNRLRTETDHSTNRCPKCRYGDNNDA